MPLNYLNHLILNLDRINEETYALYNRCEAHEAALYYLYEAVAAWTKKMDGNKKLADFKRFQKIWTDYYVKEAITTLNQTHKILKSLQGQTQYLKEILQQTEWIKA